MAVPSIPSTPTTMNPTPAQPPRPTQPLRLHAMALSGHCHRVSLLLSLLGLPHETLAVDLRAGAHKSPAFLAMNPFGQVPVLEDGDVVVGDSLAILVYLAARYDPARWMPATPIEAAEQQRWFAQAAGTLAFGPAAARVHKLFGAPLDLPLAQSRGLALFGVMERHLAGRPFLLGERAMLPDLAMYAYTARAPEGGISLQDFPALRAWLARVEALPGFVPMPVAA